MCRGSWHRYDQNQIKTEKLLYDKNVVALRNDRDILAVGSAAMKYTKRTRRMYRSLWPMTNGVIANLTEAEIVLSHFAEKLLRDTAGCNTLMPCQAISRR